jgi:L-lactate dehydrogenase complex protein LldE
MSIQRSDDMPREMPRVGLFVTCLVDLFRPSIGFAAVKLLEQAGCQVEVPAQQVCCGQPAYNSGDDRDARRIATQTIDAFEGYDYVVAPSGSCAGMIKEHYPRLFPASAPQRARARDLAARTHELLSFLTDVMGVNTVSARFPATATYHDSCSGLRELGVQAQPRALLASVEHLTLTEMRDSNVCCGFGGTFCVKFPRISERLVSDKLRCVTDSGADVLLGGDLGCLLNMAGRFRRTGSSVRVFHTAEVLAGMADGLALGEEAS